MQNSVKSAIFFNLLIIGLHIFVFINLFIKEEFFFVKIVHIVFCNISLVFT